MLDALAPDRRLLRAEIIRYRLRLAGWTASLLDTAHGLPKGTIDIAMKRPHAAGERAIATALQERADSLWPDRYDVKTGERLSPQPRKNHEPPASLEQRRAAYASLGVAS